MNRNAIHERFDRKLDYSISTKTIYLFELFNGARARALFAEASVVAGTLFFSNYLAIRAHNAARSASRSERPSNDRQAFRAREIPCSCFRSLRG